jgi:hypothetical protein
MHKEAKEELRVRYRCTILEMAAHSSISDSSPEKAA